MVAMRRPSRTEAGGSWDGARGNRQEAEALLLRLAKQATSVRLSLGATSEQ